MRTKEDYRNILVFGETAGERISSMTTQLLRIGKTLSVQLKRELCLIFLGGESPMAVETAYGWGADRVYTAVHPLLEHYITEPFLQAMVRIVEKLRPGFILFGQDDTGLDLAPRLAFRLGTGVTMDCVELRAVPEEGLLDIIKPVFGGKALGRFRCTDRFPQIAAVREGAYDPADYMEPPKKEVIPVDLALDPDLVRTVFVQKEEDPSLALALKLASANIVVSGGRGLKKKEGVDLIRESADLLGGAIAGSRPAVDHGWIPSSLQVGLTGKKVNPQVYIAVGISGALQHMAGCMKSKTIVAVNTDDSAPIFRLAHIGVVGDYREVLKGFNEELRKMKEPTG